ncbi:rhodanese-like domain-containing protein [Snodgrassella sp. B3837]|uniref:rhodanese-like domain-containing protein n=1 Tax=Snodgrassella sp. B3837 TaxID=2818040 RepID=UPI00226993F9|nr:rhodanese-like domain-containing protein [Snodgrassella sp. B3837]MCX8753941.1 rhodanese-like domain-containing protein [Snodgrassella sp. B3837]
MLKLSQIIYIAGILFFFSVRILAQELSACLNDKPDLAQQPVAVNWPQNHVKQPLDHKYWLSIKVLSQPQWQDAVWVDIRTGAVQKETGLKMLAVPLSRLSSADFLADKTVILVGTGFDELQINQTIKNLRKKGFNHVYALRGGFFVWEKVQNHNKPNLQEISALEFLSGGQSIQWQVISIGLHSLQLNTLPELPAKQFSLAQISSPELKQYISQSDNRNDAFIRYVLVSPDEQTLRLLQRQMSFAENDHIVWLQGGLAAYQQYIQQQNNLMNHAGQSLSRPCRITI